MLASAHSDQFKEFNDVHWTDFLSSNVDDREDQPDDRLMQRVSSRQAVILGLDGKAINARFAYSIGEAVHAEKSRSHRLKKSRRRRAYRQAR